MLLGCALWGAPAAADPPTPPRPADPDAHDVSGILGCVGPASPVPDALLRAAADAGREVRATRALPKEGTPLAGRVIALSAGHGTLVQDDGTGWRWQRDVTHGLREDIHTNQWMIDFVIPYLERAGAEIVTMRERHYGEWAQHVDDTDVGYREEGAWSTGSLPGYAEGAYRFALGGSGASATWTFTAESTGTVPLYAFVVTGSNRHARARYRATGAFGERVFELDQSQLLIEAGALADGGNDPPLSDANRTTADVWFRLGEVPVREGEQVRVTLDAAPSEAEGVVIADAMRLGAGMGEQGDANGETSGVPRWQESASTYIAWNDAPRWLQVNDVSSRPMYALYRGADAYVSLHTNCCNASGTSTYTWYPEMWVGESRWPDGFAEEELPPGTYRFSDAAHDAVIARIRATWDAGWDDDGHIGANFGELRALRNAWANDVEAGIDPPLAIPAFLMEVAFHDTAYDASFIRELGYRHEVARGLVAGIARYFGGEGAAIPPYAPQSVSAISSREGLVLEWEPRVDPLEPLAEPSEYHVYGSDDGVLFERLAVTEDTRYVVPLSECTPRFVRVDAANDGGRSLDGPVVAAARAQLGAPRVLFVDGVDREVAQVSDPSVLRSYARIYAPALLEGVPGAGLDSTTDERAGAALAARGYDLVVWALGETSTRDETFGGAEQTWVREYVEAGGRLIVSGAELGWDLVERGSEADRAFFEETLGARYVGDDAQTTTLDASPLGGELGALVFGDCSADALCVEFPDVLSPQDGGAFLATYASGDAAIVGSPSGRVAVSGVPLEWIAGADDRSALIGALARRLLPEPGRLGACEDGEEPPPEWEAPPDAGGDGDGGGSQDAGDAGEDAVHDDASETAQDAAPQDAPPDNGAADDAAPDAPSPRSDASARRDVSGQSDAGANTRASGGCHVSPRGPRGLLWVVAIACLLSGGRRRRPAVRATRS